jgi:hypothetical protein
MTNCKHSEYGGLNTDSDALSGSLGTPHSFDLMLLDPALRPNNWRVPERSAKPLSLRHKSVPPSVRFEIKRTVGAPEALTRKCLEHSGHEYNSGAS